MILFVFRESFLIKKEKEKILNNFRLSVHGLLTDFSTFEDAMVKVDNMRHNKLNEYSIVNTQYDIVFI